MCHTMLCFLRGNLLSGESNEMTDDLIFFQPTRFLIHKSTVVTFDCGAFALFRRIAFFGRKKEAVAF
ncbi:MAG TPA: hypothetical protein DDX51_02420 [Clostridiales bacterium]|nr:hypothetical protein [Clostridiales bacterium]